MKFTTYSHWQQLPDKSDELFKQAEKESVFFSQEWLENISNSTLGDERKLLLACVVEDSKVRAILPIAQPLDPNNKEWTGLQHSYSSLFSLLITTENQVAVLKCLAKGIASLPFEYLTLEPFAENDHNIQGLQKALEAEGLNCFKRFRFYNWFHTFNGETYSDYLAQRPSRLRNTIQRKQRKLEREQNAEIKLLTKQEALNAMPDYFAAYNASWKAHEQYQQLVMGFMQTFTANDWIRLAILTINEKPIAAQLWFVVQNKASIFRLAHDQQWAKYSPGSILMAALMKQVIDIDKVTEIDFLTGNDNYKKDWMSNRRERYSLTTHKLISVKSNRGFFTRIKDFIHRNDQDSK